MMVRYNSQLELEVALNDSYGKSFSEIAVWLEKNLSGRLELKIIMANFTLTRGMKNNDLLVEIKERLAVSQVV